VTEHDRPFLERDADPEPLRQFARWYEEAGAAVRVPQAMALATAALDGAPSVRMVLLSRFDEHGFVFHTSYLSRKGAELAANDRVALLFHWDPLGRQVRIEGVCDPVSRTESEAYFASRPRGNRIAAHASRQSAPIGSRDELEARWAELEGRFAGEDVPLPAGWGGYRVVAQAYEFWQHRDDRLHDRLRYTRTADGWRRERLQP
jgi:pyridoxamine 5'-phosphate oxidase